MRLQAEFHGIVLPIPPRANQQLVERATDRPMCQLAEKT
jgi:hypothetical protein